MKTRNPSMNFDRVGEPLPHRDLNNQIFLWDDQVQGPPPPYAPPGTRIDPYGNIIHDEPAVTPFEPGAPALPLTPARPPLATQVPRGPRDLGGYFPPRDPFTQRVPGFEQVPASPSPSGQVPRPPAPPSPPRAPGEQVPRPRFPAPPLPPRTPPLGPYGTGEPPPTQPPAGSYGADTGEGPSPPIPPAERPPLNILQSIATFALLTSPAWITFLVIRTRRP